MKKEKAKELDLPNITEWVLTTQNHIDDIKKKIDECADEADLDLFKKIVVVPMPPEEERKEWLKQ